MGDVVVEICPARECGSAPLREQMPLRIGLGLGPMRRNRAMVPVWVATCVIFRESHTSSLRWFSEFSGTSHLVNFGFSGAGA